MYLEDVLREWKKKCSGMGVSLNDEETLFTLGFADDRVIIAQDQHDAEFITQKLVANYRKWGLEVNVRKTEMLTIGGNQLSIELDDGRQISILKYLRVLLAQDGRLNTAIMNRNMQGRTAIAMLNGVIWDQRISKEKKKKD